MKIRLETTDYIDTPTKVRVFYEGPGWAIDGADDGGYTESCRNYDDDGEPMTRERAIVLAPAYAAEHGWSDLPIVVLDEDGSPWRPTDAE